MSNPGTSGGPALGDVVARFGAATQASIGAVGPGGQSGISLQSGEDQIYRLSAGVIRTDGEFHIAGPIRGTGGGNLVISPTAELYLQSGGANRIHLTSTEIQLLSPVTTRIAPGDANPAFQIDNNGTLHWGAGGASALDTALTRTGAGYLALGNLRLAAADTGNTVYSTAGDLGLGSASGIISLQVRLRNAAATNEATAATAGTNGAPPAQVAGYMIFQDSNSVVRKIPYYAN